MQDFKTYLLSAYAVKPNSGSEPGLGWEWLKALSEKRLFKITLITESEFKSDLDKELAKLSHVEVVYIAQPDFVRRMCWNQGSWLFYFFYRLWQMRALGKLLLIRGRGYFDYVHHLNMIGYREPGCLWLLGPKEKFILGPLGGLNDIPHGFLKLSLKMRLKEKLNLLGFYDPYVLSALKSADVIFAANSNSKLVLSKYNYSSVLLNETGVYVSNIVDPNESREIDLLWVGKMVSRKMPDLFLSIAADLGDLKTVVIGDTGVYNEKCKIYSANMDFTGVLPREEVLKIMRKSKILLFPSVDEGTPWVVLEALSMGTIVIAHDLAGMSDILPNEWLVKARDFEDSKVKFTEKIMSIMNDQAILRSGCLVAREYAEKSSWTTKIEEFCQHII